MVRRHSDRQLALEADPDVTNREKAIELLRWLGRGAGDDEERIESALNAERKAGELEWQIRALEFSLDELAAAPFSADPGEAIRTELDRLRAEKAKRGSNAD